MIIKGDTTAIINKATSWQFGDKLVTGEPKKKTYRNAFMYSITNTERRLFKEKFRRIIDLTGGVAFFK